MGVEGRRHGGGVVSGEVAGAATGGLGLVGEEQLFLFFLGRSW